MALTLPHAFIFDLDDTLVRSRLDFAQMRRDINCPVNVDILQHVVDLTAQDPELGQIAAAINEAHEVVEAQSSTWLVTRSPSRLSSDLRFPSSCRRESTAGPTSVGTSSVAATTSAVTATGRRQV